MSKKNDIRIEWWDVDALSEHCYAENPKEHDIEGLTQSIQRYGFRDPIAFDATLGAFAEGNGRAEALTLLRNRNAAVPKGIKVSDGKWLVPVIVGTNSKTKAEAVSYLIDHNSLTLGKDFSPLEVLRLYNRDVLKRLDEAEVPITFTNPVIANLIKARQTVTGNTEPEPPKSEPMPPPQESSEPESETEQELRVILAFASSDAFVEFEIMTKHLAKVFEKETVTDTVLECLRRLYRPIDPEFEERA